MDGIRSTWCISLLALGLALPACGRVEARPIAVDRDRAGLIARVHASSSPSLLTLADETDGRTVTTVRVPPHVELLPIPYVPIPGHTYSLRNATGAAATYAAADEAGLAIEWRIPAGAPLSEHQRVVLPRGSTVTASLTIRNLESVSKEVELDIHGVADSPRRHVTLLPEPEEYTLFVDLPVPRAHGDHVLRARVGPVEASIVIVAEDPESLANALALVQTDCPVDALGNPPEWASPDVVGLPHPWVLALARRLDVPGVALDGVLPVAYHAVSLRNTGDAAQRLLVGATLTRPGETAMLPMFEPSPWLAPQGGGTAPALLALEPGEVGQAVLPIYLQAPVTAGTYERRITVTLAGSSTVLRAWSLPLGILAPDTSSAWTVLGGVSVALGGTALLFRRLPALARSRGLRALTTVALLGSVTSVAGVVGSSIASLSTVVFGPFAQFAGGFIDEFLQAALVVAAVVLIPKPGTAALTGTTAFVLTSLLFHGLGVLALVTTALKYTLVECLLWLGGATRGAAPSTLRTLDWWRAALAFAVADAATLYVSFALFRVFYRLYFASWYVAAAILIPGFLYTWLGALAGVRLAHGMRWANR